MAIRKLKNLYYIYYRDPETGVQKALPTGVTTIEAAQDLDILFMASIRAARARKKIGIAIKEIAFEPADKVKITFPKRKRFLLTDAVEIAERYRPVADSAKKEWKRFLSFCPYKHFDELTRENCHELLNAHFPDGSEKSYNNLRWACNRIVRSCLIDVGEVKSPFEDLPPRVPRKIKRQRAFTEKEFKAMLKVAWEPMKTAMLIAWFTGLRKKDAYSVGWENVIEGDIIDALPFKTRQKGIRVYIPIHPQLMKVVKKYKKRKEPWAYCAHPAKLNCRNRSGDFAKIMKLAGIVAKSDEDLNFDCIRNSYIDRMADFGIEEDIRKQIVGHTETRTHDHYRGFIDRARVIQEMPGLDI